MKKSLIVLLLTFGSVVSYAQEIKWMTFNEAMELQKKKSKTHFYGCLHGLVRTLQNVRQKHVSRSKIRRIHY